MYHASKIDSYDTLPGFAAQSRMVRLLILQPRFVTLGIFFLDGQSVTSHDLSLQVCYEGSDESNLHH